MPSAQSILSRKTNLISATRSKHFSSDSCAAFSSSVRSSDLTFASAYVLLSVVDEGAGVVVGV
jgi:hypothetical protein